MGWTDGPDGTIGTFRNSDVLTQVGLVGCGPLLRVAWSKAGGVRCFLLVCFFSPHAPFSLVDFFLLNSLHT
jgi:hypothetical protein